jgi:Tfp pilus assembly protein PilZ
MSSDRRRSARIDILGRLHGHVVSLDLPVAVREISLGGMSLETPFAFPVGELHHFTLTLGDGSTVPLAGRVVYCRSLATSSDSPAFLTGIQFEDDVTSEPEAVGDLLEKLK